MTEDPIDEEVEEEEIKQSYYGSGLVREDYLIYYPLLVYNSHLPDNSELVVTNMAERNKTS